MDISNLFADFSQLMTGPVMTIGAVLTLVCLWISHAIGKSKEYRRKVSALVKADQTAKTELESLRSIQEKEIQSIKKASIDEIENLRKTNVSQIDQLKQDHKLLIDAMNEHHAGEIKRLQQEHSTLINEFASINRSNIDELKAEQDRRIDEIKVLHADELMHQQNRLSKLNTEREGLKDRIAELDGTVAELRSSMKESKASNIYSITRSGERLVSVVRSVQQLANELNETSLVVTGGEYSFFEQIKDQRDKDTVLGLTGSAELHDKQGETTDTSVIEVPIDTGKDHDRAEEPDEDERIAKAKSRLGTVDMKTDGISSSITR
ncbi:MAG: hypothetical protein AB2632_19610 [Candidatus Thiodiazotropha sp.]